MSKPTKRTAKAVAKKQKPAKPASPPTAPSRPDANPYREGSAYGKIYDVLASHPSGVTRAELLAEAQKATRKTKDRTNYDLAVVVSPRTANGPRHTSARPGYHVERKGDRLILRRG
ncbi:hypothetical protein HQ590_15475 [bacterium]|nr:hypothetical protein [bacterium]